MRTLLLCLALPLLTWGADDDAWAKLRDVKSGAEIRVYKIGAAQPLTVKMGELTDENLVIINKDKQTAIARDQLERVEARPAGKGRTMTSTTKTTDSVGDPKAVIPGPDQQGTPGPRTSTSTSSSVTLDKPAFEVVYRRQAGAPKKK